MPYLAPNSARSDPFSSGIPINPSPKVPAPPASVQLATAFQRSSTLDPKQGVVNQV